MIELVINDIDISDKVQSLQLTAGEKKSNGFTDVNGQEINRSLGRSTGIKVKVTELDENLRAELMTALEGGTVEVEATGASGSFEVDGNYSFNYLRRAGKIWEADFSLTQFSAASGGDSL